MKRIWIIISFLAVVALAACSTAPAASDNKVANRQLSASGQGKVYLVPAGDHRAIPGYEVVGIEPLSREFTRQRLRGLLRGRRDQVRAFLQVRNRKGQPCSRCGTPIRVEGVRGLDTFYCPTCQPNRPEARLGRRQLVDWSRLAPQEPKGKEE